MSESTAKVCRVIRLRINSDGPGVRSVVFLYGCPLQCEWCCNPETRFGNKYYTVTARQLYDLVKRDLPYFRESGGGVTFTGGEPMSQQGFIREFMNLVQGEFPVALETSLYASREAVEDLLPDVEHWYVDYKAHNPEEHLHHTGVSPDRIRENLALLAREAGPDKITLTYPVVPGRNDSEENVRGMIGFMRQLGVSRVQLHPYRKNREQKYEKQGLPFEPIEPLSRVTLDRIRDAFLRAGIALDEPVEYRERGKCNYLKNIRREICAREEIPLEFPECPHKGPCPGTCPKCEAELFFINEWRENRNAPPTLCLTKEEILCESLKL